MLNQGTRKRSQENVLPGHRMIDGFIGLLHKTSLGMPKHSTALKIALGEQHESVKHQLDCSVTSHHFLSVNHAYSLGFTVSYHTDDAHNKQGNTDSRDG